MKVILLPSSFPNGQGMAGQYATSYVIDGAVAIDAGCLGFVGEFEEQAAVRHVFVSHSHIDHVASLPVFVENVYGANGDCVTVYGNQAVLDSLQRDVFNNRLWPDFVAMSSNGSRAPFLRLEVLNSGQPCTVGALTIRPLPVHHVVPTHGFIVSGEGSSVAISSDTGPTELLWRESAAVPDLKAIFVEVTFPNRFASLAELSLHLTPALLAAEIRKMPAGVPIHAVHLKARFREEIVRELDALKIPHLHVAQFGCPYEF